MKINTTLTKIVFAAALLSASAVHAVTVTLNLNDDYYLGSFAPGQPSGDSFERQNTQNLIYLFNGDALFNSTLNGRTFAGTTDGSLIPFLAPNLTANGTQQAQNGHTYATNSATYLLGKYSNEIAYVWYVGGLTDVTLPSNIQGLSHVTRFGYTPPTPPGTTGVPEGGSTAAILGLGLALLAIARRKLA